MRIGAHDLDERVLLVAEAGNNHEGDVELARELVRQAAATGVDAIKFQTFRTERYVAVSEPERRAQLERLELAPEAFEELAQLARSCGLLFISTPFDLGSLELLVRIADAVKIASGDNDFLALVRAAAASPRPLIISCGATGLDALARTMAVVERARPQRDPGGDVALLHAVASYPTPPEQAGLRTIGALAERFGRTVGYSDHTLGSDAAPLAVALGARIVEKHFTLEGIASDFRDHALSLTPPAMAELVRRVRGAERMLRERRTTLAPAERPTARAIRRSIAAVADLPAGHVLADRDLTWLRPGTGLRPGEEGRLRGRALTRAVRAGELLGPGDVA